VDNGDGTYTGMHRLLSLRIEAQASTVPCDAAPEMSLTFGGTEFNVAPDTFVLGAGAGATHCLGGLSYNDAIAGRK